MTKISVDCIVCKQQIIVDEIIFENSYMRIKSSCGHIHNMSFVNHGGGLQDIELSYKGVSCKCGRHTIPYENTIIECMYCTLHEHEIHYSDDPHYINCKDHLVSINNIDISKKEIERELRRKMRDYAEYLDLLNTHHSNLIAWTYQEWRDKKNWEWSDHDKVKDY